MTIFYNLEKMFEKYIGGLLNGKVLIESKEEEAPYSFTFENLTNPSN